jgi:peroxiredoxin
LIGLLGLAGTWALTEDTTPKPVPTFKLRDLDGNAVALADFKDKALVIVFWTTWAQPCRDYLPTLVELQRRFGGDEFLVIGLALDEKGAKQVKAFAAENKLNFPILMADYPTVQAFGGVTGLPTTFVAERKHFILQRYEGIVEKKVLLADVAGILTK